MRPKIEIVCASMVTAVSVGLLVPLAFPMRVRLVPDDVLASLHGASGKDRLLIAAASTCSAEVAKAAGGGARPWYSCSGACVRTGPPVSCYFCGDAEPIGDVTESVWGSGNYTATSTSSCGAKRVGRCEFNTPPGGQEQCTCINDTANGQCLYDLGEGMQQHVDPP